MKSEEFITKGDFKTLSRISLPLMLFLLCESLSLFCERIFLSHHSPTGVHTSLNATYLTFIFQNPCMAISAMAQVFVGLYQGRGEQSRIGPCVWQLIWFSVLSIFLTLPLSYFASSMYFKDTIIQQTGPEYFTIFAFFNFLFPLNTALSSFYLGRGKTLMVTTTMVASYALHLLLSWLLIFGVPGIIPPLGFRGAALAKGISLGIFCSFLFWHFLSKKNQEIYHTHEWRFDPKALWSYMRPGLVRAFGYLYSRVSWATISSIMMKKGGAHLDVLTTGGNVIIFLVFISNGIYQSILTIASNLLGSKNYLELWRLCRSFILYILLIGAVLAVILLVFPHALIGFFDTSAREVFEKTIQSINHWIWLYIVALTLQMSLCALLVAARDLKFQVYSYLCAFFTSLLPVYLVMRLGVCQPDKLWLIMAMENIIFSCVFFLRFRYKQSRDLSLAQNKPISSSLEETHAPFSDSSS